MSDALIAVSLFALIVIGALIATLLLTKREHVKVLTAFLEQQLEREKIWNEERQLLLDRIQAPSFGEMKQAEVKKIRAENGEKPPEPLIPV